MLRPHDLIAGRTLRAVSELISANSSYSDLDHIMVTGVSIDSHQIEAGDLFVAVAGEKAHGATYAGSAKLNGAVAVLTDQVGAALVTDMPVIIVANPRAAAGVVSAWLHNEPMRDMFSVGVTGTNGKTTVTALTTRMLKAAGQDVVMAGNIGPTLLDTLRECIDTDLPEVWVLELSSFQLDNAGPFEPSAATVLNITQDHLDWHGSMDAYAAAKQKIFGSTSLMVLNREDARVMAMLPEPVRAKLQKPIEREHLTFGADMPQRPGDFEIGRASCRERVLRLV